MNYSQYLAQYNQFLSECVISDADKTFELQDGFNEIIGKIEKLKVNNGTVCLVGNGGSNGIASHSRVDFINACGIKSHTFTDGSLLTCMANDYGYENIFSEPLRKLITANDCLIAISSSGNSKNITNAVDVANDVGALSITLSGFLAENKLRSSGNINLWISSKSYGYVETGHAFLLHYITDMLSGKKYMDQENC
ncbi:MAG: SIS domain-containing protein [Flavobacteriales bacterium]|nr:SIS domain-containing protein [Flavobacteriales bacterium]